MGAMPDSPPVFHFINDSVPAETRQTLQTACLERGVECRETQFRQFIYRPENQCEDGDMLYRPATSMGALRVEQFMISPRTATFYREPAGCFFAGTGFPPVFTYHGVPTPRTVSVTQRSRVLLRQHVDELGGFPVVAKVMGFSGGAGVVKIDNWATLYSFVDYAMAVGHQPLLQAFIEEALHWRTIVVGDRVVAAHRNTPEPDDFRTYAADDPSVVGEAPPEVTAASIAAVHALRLEFGGVDVLEHPSGRVYVLEANFPCYFAHAQVTAGVDISGAMVDHLLAKRMALLAQ
jgi:hypothetical protein